jgi:hypothetical protein
MKTLLLCHGTRHRKYAKYYKCATTIDIDKNTKPHIVHNIKSGLPKLSIKYNLIQSVYWPQLHRCGLKIDFERNKKIPRFTPIFKILRSRIIARDRYCIYNYKLLKSIYNNLEIGGYLVFFHEGNSTMLNKLQRAIGFKKISLLKLENYLNTQIKPSNHGIHQLVCYQKI